MKARAHFGLIQAPCCGQMLFLASIATLLMATSATGAVVGVVGIEGGVVSGVINLESSDVGASDWRPRHEKHYQQS